MAENTSPKSTGGDIQEAVEVAMKDIHPETTAVITDPGHDPFAPIPTARFTPPPELLLEARGEQKQ